MIGAQLKSKSLSFKVQINKKGISKADYPIQNSHYQQLADNGSKLAYLPAIIRLILPRDSQPTKIQKFLDVSSACNLKHAVQR